MMTAQIMAHSVMSAIPQLTVSRHPGSVQDADPAKIRKNPGSSAIG
jgi:hypothetical protein